MKKRKHQWNYSNIEALTEGIGESRIPNLGVARYLSN